MKHQLLNIVMLLLVGTSILGACSNENDVTPHEPQQKLPSSEISIDLALDESLTPEDAESLKSFSYDLGANRNGHPHPNMTMNLNSGAKPKLHLLFANSKSKKTFVSKNMAYTYENGTIKVSRITLTGVNNTTFNTDNSAWSVYCVLGGEVNDRNEITYEAQKSLSPLQAGDKVSIDAIYMSKAWVTLASSNVNGVLTFYPKNGTHATLKSRMTTFMCRLKNDTKAKTLKVRGFDLSTDNLSFGGTFSLGGVQVGSVPAYKTSNNSKRARFLNKDGVEVVSFGGNFTKYYLCTGVPTGTSLNMRITPLFGDVTVLRAKSVDYTKKTVAPGGYFGVNDIVYSRRELRHPIEGVLLTRDNQIYVAGTGDYKEQSDATYSIRVNDDSREYRVPTVHQLAVLVPGMYGGTPPLAPGGHGYLDFKSGKDQNSISESIAPWTTGSPTTYTASYRNASGSGSQTSIFYGTRFEGSQNYYSAYRYERLVRYDGAEDWLKIRVRTLKPQVRVDQVANESWWNSDPDWDQEEYTVMVPRGIYFSSTSTQRAGQTVHHAMKVFTYVSNDGNIVYRPDEAFVTDDNHKSFADNLDRQKNKSHMIPLMTTNYWVSKKPSKVLW